MIGRLKGLVDSTGEDWVIIDVGGVGYEVTCSVRTLTGLPAVGEAVSLSIETHVREDAIRLFGFSSPSERAWFRLLQGVQGVGAKVALALLGTLTTDELANAIALQDKAQVSRAPGVGPKVAGRIVTELKDRMPAILGAEVSEFASGGDGSTAPIGTAALDAVSALTNLGYAQAQASAAVASAAKKAGDGAETKELIRLGLKELAQ